MSRDVRVDLKVKEDYDKVIDRYENISPNEARDILDSKYAIKEKKKKIDMIAEAMEKQFEQTTLYKKYHKP